VTERGVFELGPDGLCLIEIAPGVDYERDIAPIIGAKFHVAEDLRQMDPSYFREQPLDWPSLQTTVYRTCAVGGQS